MFRFQIKLAGRYLWGRKLRTFLTTLAIVFGTLVIFGMDIILPTMMQSFQSNLLAASGQVDVTITLKSGEAFSRKTAQPGAGGGRHPGDCRVAEPHDQYPVGFLRQGGCNRPDPDRHRSERCANAAFLSGQGRALPARR